MRIVHAVRSQGFAGVERHIATLAGAQSAAGHSVMVIGGDQARMADTLRRVNVATLPGATTASVANCVRHLKGADLVHAHMTAAELASSLSANCPIIVTRHFARPRGASTLGRASAQFIRRRIAAQIAISNYVAGAIDGDSTVVYPGVSSADARSTERRPIILVVQRLQAEKDTDVALRAFAAGAPMGWTLEVVGDGAERSALQSLAQQLGIAPRTRFLGFRDDVMELMRSASVLLAPCEVEGLGLSVLEAMAQGLPVVASRAGAHPETVGLAADAQLFSAGDSELAGAMLRRLCADSRLRSRYGRQLASAQRATFTPTAQAEATEAVYRRILA